jgi:hypothetical protein
MTECFMPSFKLDFLTLTLSDQLSTESKYILIVSFVERIWIDSDFENKVIFLWYWKICAHPFA